MLFNRGDVCGRDEFKTDYHYIVVDTCFTADTGMYETGVAVDGDNMVIVDYYGTAEEAKQGHSDWVKRLNYKDIHLISAETGEEYDYPGELRVTVIIDSEVYSEEYVEDMQTLFKLFESTGRLTLKKRRGFKYTYACADNEIYNLIEHLANDYNLYETLD